ncbi:hypothetical protein ACFY1L_28995 [Streptomyces sp. NPDC001663]
MTAHTHTRPASKLRRTLAALLRMRPTHGAPDVWLAGLRLGG